MRRRDFLMGSAAAAWSLAAHAQQPIPAIGYLSAATLDDYTKPQIGAFRVRNATSRWESSMTRRASQSFFYQRITIAVIHATSL